MRDTIDIAREAGFADWLDARLISPQPFERLVALVRADERKSKSHSLGPGEMEMILRREHNGELFEYRYRFTQEQVLHSPFHLINTAGRLDAEMTQFIKSREAK
jgi:hypothetical protein